MAKNKKDNRYDIIVVGGGLAGRIATLAAAARGFGTALIAPDSSEPDGRTTALLSDSIQFLSETGIWETLSQNAFPLRTMRIVDATERLIRAPQVDFVSSEINLEAFGYNFENKIASQKLGRLIEQNSKITWIKELAGDVTINPASDQADLKTQSGAGLTAPVILAADGRKSHLRNALNISISRWQYPQIALVTNLSHTHDHWDTSTEFHTRKGPMTLVPLGEKKSSLVCVVDPATADQLLALEDGQLERELERRMHSVLGKITRISPIGRFPLSGARAKQFGLGNVALIGEAGHAFPPIGAQGLNLSIRDVRTALDLVAVPSNQDFGKRYHVKRNADISSRTACVDLLNRSLLSNFLPTQIGRSLGLYLLDTIGPLRRTVMREGVLPGKGLNGPLAKAFPFPFTSSHSASNTGSRRP